jgi:hypothetical protein
MSRARFLLATQNISDHTTCSAHAFASVCLHAAIIPPARTESGPLVPAPLQKSANLTGASLLPAKTRSAFDRAVSVLSP